MFMLSISSCNDPGEAKDGQSRGLIPSETIVSQGIKLNVYDFDGLTKV